MHPAHVSCIWASANVSTRVISEYFTLLIKHRNLLESKYIKYSFYDYAFGSKLKINPYFSTSCF